MVTRMIFKKHKSALQTALKLTVIVLLVYYVAHHCKQPTGLTLPLPLVVVQTPVLANMVEYVTQTGTTVAFNSVDLVARVEGYLDAIAFTDGTFVKKGKELFVIEPEPYLEQLKAAQAQVAIAKAESAYTKSEYARQQRMYKQHATSLNNVESWFAKSTEAEAEVAKAVANERSAAITYSYTHVLAPFNGRIGRHMVSLSNLVGNGVATVLATIEQIDPLYVYFNLNELDLIKLRAAARQSGMKPDDIKRIPVSISLQNDTDFKYKATLNFVNTGLNASTGTMELRALLPNKSYFFVPGLFVQVRVAITKPTPQLTIPDTAVLYDQIGPYVYTIDKQQLVVLQRVVLGPLEKGMRGVVKGLAKTDRVIVEGLQNATPGNPVNPQASSKAPQS